RGVSAAFVVAALAGIAFIVVFCAWPFEYKLPHDGQNFAYFTPLLGSLLGLMLIGLGIGAVLWAKWLMPEEEAVQDRHDDPSPEPQKLMAAATLTQGLHDTGLPRRSLLVRSMVLAGGA